MKKVLFQTNKNNGAATIIRIILGTVLFAHGAQKLLGWFGGYGFTGTMKYFTETVNLPWLVGFAVIIIEFFGALSIIVGFATRLWAIIIFFLALGIVLTSRTEYGFFMNWFNNKPGEGYEYFLLMMGLAVALVHSGGGKLSVDRLV
ncbi:MAG: DoxX family protein [Chitinophagaceae bacterium]